MCLVLQGTVVSGERRLCFLAFAADQLIAKNIRNYCFFFFFLIVSNLSTEALFNVLSLFEMWNLSATISIQMQGGHKTYLVQRITEL